MAVLNRFDRYLFRLIIVPLFATLVIAAMLLLLDKMLNLFDFVINEGGPVNVVWKMLGNLLPEYLSLGIPIGVMLGILLAFRRLALSSELDALRAVGIGYGRLLRVPYLFAFGFACLNLAIVGYLQPLSRYAYEGLRYELRTGALGASIKVGEFTQLGERMTLRVEQSMEGGADLRGVFVRAGRADGASLAVSAARGAFLRTDDPDVILLRLRDGTLVHDAPGYAAARVLAFRQHDLPVALPQTERFRARGVVAAIGGPAGGTPTAGSRELTIDELARAGRDASLKPQQRDAARASFHRRVIQCVAMFVLPLLAVALAVPPKRSTSAIGVFLGVVMLVTYHKVTEYGERMGSIGRVDPLVAQWVPFALFAALAGWMYHVLAHRPGGQPIGALDRWAGKAGAALKRLRARAGRRGVRGGALAAGRR